ncbi:hypothetical protein RvY_02896 [Ramazzottius varieornatus]|uniref:DUF7164 domain-containing protein n=1 Tax=Ramazzottius varieornatus TaxID=947166 RepID=A0A1D1UL85_RAMVA|nr:hypothetical protein RvY_02896 [Ramazzottius varieornatus]
MKARLFGFCRRSSGSAVVCRILILGLTAVGSFLATYRSSIQTTGATSSAPDQSTDDTLLLDHLRLCGKHRLASDYRLMPLTRAVVAYFPVKQLEPYLGQLKWCLRSLLEMMKDEPKLWRTDIVLYVEDLTSPELRQLGCSTTARQNASEPFKCILVKYTKVQDRVIDPKSSGYDRELKDQFKEYSFIDSIAPLAEQPEVYLNYDFVVRSDLDVFFTPAFSKWIPPGCTFITGNGGYSDPYNLMKLALVANHSGSYFNSSIWNIGSTWVGPAPLISKIAARTVHWMVYLSKTEFAPKMRKQSWWSQAVLWPEWHYGVLLLYGGQLAINEILHAGRRYPFQKIDLDHPTTSTAACTETGPIHLHTYQSDTYFSKYRFASGAYKNTHSLPIVLNSSRCCDYAGYIAGDSLSMSPEVLANSLHAIKRYG